MDKAMDEGVDIFYDDEAAADWEPALDPSAIAGEPDDADSACTEDDNEVGAADVALGDMFGPERDEGRAAEATPSGGPQAHEPSASSSGEPPLPPPSVAPAGPLAQSSDALSLRDMLGNAALGCA